ncbi:hypothetical protein [Photobacterium leiognathi]|uniref:hypothetical protein n=1 Tax=Photobacterium leiognathi TaxID=553611 RepID=UPI002738FBC3|nr:hypothetical protein [Photobacterium leiognathi]
MLATIGTVTATPIIAGIATVIGTGILIAAIYKHLSNTTANVNEALSKANNPESQKIIRENQKVAVDIFNKMESKQAVDIFNKMESKQAVDIFNKWNQNKQSISSVKWNQNKQSISSVKWNQNKQSISSVK